MTSPLEILRASTSFDIVDQLELPARGERLLPVPLPYGTGKTAEWLRAMTDGATQLRSHQSLALSTIASGGNLVVSTGTASGKSLVFQTAVIHELLTGSGTALVLYPVKALSGDQLAHWQTALSRAGLDPALVGEINGDVPMGERDKPLKEARLIIATPDVVHAWLMRQIATPAARDFLRRLRLLVLDEAHMFEGVLGSTSAFLFRRLRSAQHRILTSAGSSDQPMQIIAATATIADPAQHLKLLTGMEFNAVTEEDNGAPCYQRTLLHIDGPSHGGPAERMIADILIQLAERIGSGAFIAFHDSRQGVERIAKLIKRKDVFPYRSGFERGDRQRIEKALREGTLKGVVATSALELGIDIRQFVIGFTIGVPRSRKSFRQRLGRVGRSSLGLFAIIAPPHAFRLFGSSLREFYEGSVEPSHLYLENTYIQFSQARCLIDECEMLGGESHLPSSVDWPEGFARNFELAKPGAARPRELELIYATGADCPHLNYPLRNIGEAKYALRDLRGSTERFGTIALSQAIREAYPGATYLHCRKAKKVREWKTNSYERSIRVEPVSGGEPTSPLLRKQVNASQSAEEVIQRHLLAGDAGCLAELHIQVTEAVEGFRSGAATFLYRDLRQKDPRMRRQQRDFSTTGVLLQISQPWFAGTATHQVAARQAVARALREVLMHEHSISPTDVDFADSCVAICGPAGPRRVDDAIVIYDSVDGGLRLTEPLFSNFGRFIERLKNAAALGGADPLVSEAIAVRLGEWFESLSPKEPAVPAPPAVGDGEYLIYAPQSEVSVSVRGSVVERRLLEPQLMRLNDNDILVYRYESEPGSLAWVAHDQVMPTGNNWQKAIWNPATRALRELHS